MTIFADLLKDPGKDLSVGKQDLYFPESDMLGSFDSVHVMNLNMKRSTPMMESASAVAGALEDYALRHKTFPEDQFCLLVGLESREIGEMLAGFVVKIFNTLYNLIKKLLEIVNTTISKLLSIDKRLVEDSNRTMEKLVEFHKKANGQLQAKANERLRYLIVSHMCTKEQFKDYITTFKLVSDKINHWILNDVGTLIDSLHMSLEFRDIEDDPIEKKIQELGITLKEKSASYASPFSEYPDSDMQTLHFGTVNDILQICQEYDKHVWVAFENWKTMKSVLQKFTTKLKAKEKELLGNSRMDKQIVIDNSKTLQIQIKLGLSIIAALRQANITLNFRRKELCKKGIDAYKYVFADSVNDKEKENRYDHS